MSSLLPSHVVVFLFNFPLDWRFWKQSRLSTREIVECDIWGSLHDTCSSGAVVDARAFQSFSTYFFLLFRFHFCSMGLLVAVQVKSSAMKMKGDFLFFQRVFFLLFPSYHISPAAAVVVRLCSLPHVFTSHPPPSHRQCLKYTNDKRIQKIIQTIFDNIKLLIVRLTSHEFSKASERRKCLHSSMYSRPISVKYVWARWKIAMRIVANWTFAWVVGCWPYDECVPLCVVGQHNGQEWVIQSHQVSEPFHIREILR